MGVKKVNLLYEDLSYQIRGAAFGVRKNYGPGHKEVLYQRAFDEELNIRKIKYVREKPIKIYSPVSGKIIGSYQPDFIVDDKIIIELKALEKISKKMIDQLYSYLRNSIYQLGFFINYGTDGVDIKRVIYTNDKKKHISSSVKVGVIVSASQCIME
jgi:GxxExxY protein